MLLTPRDFHFVLNYVYDVCFCTCVDMYMPVLSLDQDLQVVVNCLTWVLRTNLVPLQEQYVSTLTAEPSLQSHIISFLTLSLLLGCLYLCAHMGTKEQLVRVGSLLSYGSPAPDSGCQAWPQASLPAELSCQPQECYFNFKTVVL